MSGPEFTPQPGQSERPSVLEAMLSPRSVGTLLGLGAGLLVLGLVLWLHSQGLFEKPRIVAAILGAGTLGVLAAGWVLVLRTSFRMTGRALVMLACFVLPLNLWYYQEQGLLTLENRLWVPAVAVCALYAASAWTLRDPVLVPVFVFGSALTGLLILIDQQGSAEFAKLQGPIVLLHLLGLLSIHAERAFAGRASGNSAAPIPSGGFPGASGLTARPYPDPNAFSEADLPFPSRAFGLGFFWSGHVLLASALALLMGSQILAEVWLASGDEHLSVRHFLESWGYAGPVPIAVEPNLQLLALGLVLAATYAYVYSDLVVRRVGVYLPLAVLTLLWAELLGLRWLGIAFGTDLVILSLAIASVSLNLLRPVVARAETGPRGGGVLGVSAAAFLGFLAVLLTLVPVVLAMDKYLRSLPSGDLPGGWFGAAAAVAALACLINAAVSCRPGHPGVTPGVGLSTLGLGFCAVVGVATAAEQFTAADTVTLRLPITMLVPIVLMTAAVLLGGSALREPENSADDAMPLARPLNPPPATAAWRLAHVLHGGAITAAVGLCFPVIVLLLSARPTERVVLLAAFVEWAVFFGLAGWVHRSSGLVTLAVAALTGAVWQGVLAGHGADQVLIVAEAALGLACVMVGRVLRGSGIPAPRRGQGKAANLAGTLANNGQLLLSLAVAAAALHTLSELASYAQNRPSILADSATPILAMLGGMLVISLLAAVISGDSAWSPWHRLCALGEVLLAVAVLVTVASLTLTQKVEIGTTAAGLAFLLAGIAGWWRENLRRATEPRFEPDPLTGVALFLGSVLVALPVTWVTISFRVARQMSLPDEVGMLLAGVLLLGLGLALKLRSPVMMGGLVLFAYVTSLIRYLPWEHLSLIAVVLMVGGGTLFALGLVLSLYRDALLALPSRITRREGVFQVLDWR